MLASADFDLAGFFLGEGTALTGQQFLKFGRIVVPLSSEQNSQKKLFLEWVNLRNAGKHLPSAMT
jgi:hypothetical protein